MDGDAAGNGAVNKTATPRAWVTVNRLPEKALQRRWSRTRPSANR